MHDPIKVKRDELVRIYLVNMLEYDLDQLVPPARELLRLLSRPARRWSRPSSPTRSMQCQGQRGILELRFPTPGKFMFHAHQSEFTELGWMGFFEVVRLWRPHDASRTATSLRTRLARARARLAARPRCRCSDRRARSAPSPRSARPGLGDRTGPARRGARRRAHGPAPRRDRALTSATTGPTPSTVAQVSSTTPSPDFRGRRSGSGAWRAQGRRSPTRGSRARPTRSALLTSTGGDDRRTRSTPRPRRPTPTPASSG